jgi:hypothetical protein
VHHFFMQEFQRLMHGVMDEEDMDDDFVDQLWEHACGESQVKGEVSAETLAKVCGTLMAWNLIYLMPWNLHGFDAVMAWAILP